MAATIQVISCHGATITTTETNIAAALIRFKWADNDTDDILNPIVRPSSGSKYSWRKSIRPKIIVAPDVALANYRFFSDGASWGTGVTMRVHQKPVANYDQATIADQSAVITTDGGTAVVDAATLTNVSPLVVNAGTVIAATTGYGTADIIEMQLEVTSSATFGEKPAATPAVYTLRVDEY